jgi:hypothetical protein
MINNTDKIAALRREIISQIVATMKENNLEELELLDENELDDPTYVLVRCNNGDWCESVVKKVSVVGEGIELHCNDENVDAVLGSAELACNPLERLESVRQNILQTLELPDLSSVDPGKLIEYEKQGNVSRKDILNEMFNCIKAIPQGELISREAYPMNDEERDRCCIRGFEIDGDVLKAVLEYEPDFNERRISVEFLNVNDLLGIMLSMLNL